MLFFIASAFSLMMGPLSAKETPPPPSYTLFDEDDDYVTHKTLLEEAHRAILGGDWVKAAHALSQCDQEQCKGLHMAHSLGALASNDPRAEELLRSEYGYEPALAALLLRWLDKNVHLELNIDYPSPSEIAFCQGNWSLTIEESNDNDPLFPAALALSGELEQSIDVYKKRCQRTNCWPDAQIELSIVYLLHHEEEKALDLLTTVAHDEVVHYIQRSGNNFPLAPFILLQMKNGKERLPHTPDILREEQAIENDDRRAWIAESKDHLFSRELQYNNLRDILSVLVLKRLDSWPITAPRHEQQNELIAAFTARRHEQQNEFIAALIAQDYETVLAICQKGIFEESCIDKLYYTRPFWQAVVHVMQNNPQAALQIVNKEIKKGQTPQYCFNWPIESLMVRALIYDLMGQPKKAASDLKKAIQKEEELVQWFGSPSRACYDEDLNPYQGGVIRKKRFFNAKVLSELLNCSL